MVIEQQIAADREFGIVKWFDNAKGYGFVQRSSGEDVFLHFRQIRGTGYRTLHEGQRVRFSVGPGFKGMQAEDVETFAATDATLASIDG